MAGPSRKVRGGVSAAANSLLKAMPEDGPSISYVATHVDGPKALKAFAAAIGVVGVVGAVLFGGRRIVHVHMASNASFIRKSTVLRIVRLLGAKTVVHVHGGGFQSFFRDADPRMKESIRRTLERADLVLALSDEWSARLRRIAPRAKIRVLPNPVVVEDFEPAAEGRSEVPEAGGTVLFLGAFLKRKGVYDLIDAMPAVLKSRSDVVFEMGGDQEVDRVNELIRKHGLERNVRILGWVKGTDKLAAFARAHVYVLPSYIEGVPIGVLEAEAAGLPIVTTPVGGVPEIVKDGVNGFLISPGDVRALSSSILRVLEDADLRKKMSETNMRSVKSKHDASLVARTLCKWYDELAGRA
jgi:glycosyltransferase involved in cell wall biosynthesis